MAGAILWLVMRWPPSIFGHMAGAAIIVSAALVAAQPLARAAGPRRALIAVIGAIIVGAIGELLGLYYGIYGEYRYREQWQPAIRLPGNRLFPLFLPVVWHIALAGCYAYARQRLNVLGAIVGGAVLATLLDLVAEPVLTGPVGFWVWLEPTPILGAPLWNWFGWLTTSLVGCAWVAAVLKGRQTPGNEPTVLLTATLVGIATIGVTHGEPRGLWALALVPPILLWRAKLDGEVPRGAVHVRRAG